MSSRPNVSKVFISAGDSSGDIHGANLMSWMIKKSPGITFYGLGKENMKRAGLHCLHDMSAKSLMWLHVLAELTAFRQMKKDCIRFFQQERPSAVILIDYCGFNFHLARAAKKTENSCYLLYLPTALGTWTMACKKDEKNGR